jgi:hypothetical protein
MVPIAAMLAVTIRRVKKLFNCKHITVERLQMSAAYDSVAVTTVKVMVAGIHLVNRLRGGGEEGDDSPWDLVICLILMLQRRLMQTTARGRRRMC